MKARKDFLNQHMLKNTGWIILFFIACANSFAQDYIKPAFPVFNNLEVNTFNGNLVYTRQDFLIKGNMPINLSFYYNSVNDTVDYGYGSGWYFNYGMNYYFDSLNNIVLIQNGGRKDIYTASGTQYLSPVGIYDRLTEYEPQKFVLITKEEIKYYFADSAHKKLTSITDKTGNSITIVYNSGFPVAISNSSGRSAILSWAANHLTGITYNSTSYTYAYSDDYLSTVTNPRGSSESYQYHANGKISVIADYNKNPVYIEYNGDVVVNKITSCSSEKSFSFVENKSYIIENGSTGKQITCYTYDDRQRVVQITTPNQKSVLYEYDNNNNVVKFTDFEGKANQYSYDANGNLLSSTNPAGFTAQAIYNSSNKIVSSVDQKGNTTGFTYDNNGNLIGISQPQSVSSSFSYNNTGSITQSTDPLGHATGFNWDNNNNLVQISYPIGLVGMTYDNVGNLTRVTDANSNTLSFEYNACNSCGQVSKVKVNDTICTLYNYDGNGNLIDETDANGNSKSYGYDGLNRLNTVSIPAGTTSYQYDEQGNLTKVTDANSHITQYDYNSSNQVASEVDPLGKTAAYTHDANGNLISETDPNGNTLQYTYNSLNQLVQKSYPGNADHFSYDAVGNMTGMYNNDINISFTYDALNRVISKTINNWNKTISYTYDKASNRTSMTDPDGGITHYTYDANNRLTSIGNPFGETTTFEYDAGGRVLKQTNANGTFTEYVYNQRNLLTSLINKRSTGEKISGYQYTYDKYGNRLSMTVNDTAVHHYTYDASHRLTEVIYPSGETENFTYDGAGNRITQLVNNTTKTYTYNQADQLTSAGSASYTFDNNGNMTSKTDSGQTTVYEYNALNRLVKIHYPDGTENAYVYDPTGNRISASSKAGEVTNYLLDGDNVLMELNNSGNTQARYTSALNVDSWISMHRGNQSYMFHKDGLNSTTALSDASQGVSATYSYSAFGEIKNQTGNVTNPYTYTGRELDKESGNYYYRSRYYSSNNGRFISKDKFKGFITHPSSLNKYVYVNNNPVNRVDPNGLFEEEILTISLEVIGLVAGGMLASGAVMTVGTVVVGGYAAFAIGASIGNLFSEFFLQSNYRAPTTPIAMAVEYADFFGLNTNQDIMKYAEAADLLIPIIFSINPRKWKGIEKGTLKSYEKDLMKFNKFKWLEKPWSKMNWVQKINTGFSLVSNAKTAIEKTINFFKQLGIYFGFPVIRPVDPNEILGPVGYDSLKWLSVNQTMPYTILFENDPDFATAPAQNVLVKLPVGDKLNMNDFRLGSFGFGSFNFEVPENTAFYTNRLDLTDSLGLYVDVTAGLNVNTHEAFWMLESIDPATGLAPVNPLVGFLPVNDSAISPGPGEGFVTFTIKPNATDQTGDSLTALASIVFDNNAPILTNTWVNIADAAPPVSKVDSIPPAIDGNSVDITFSGADDPGGCGISTCQLYFSKDAGPYLFFGEFKADTMLKFTGSSGSAYRFFSRAKDHVGNAEPMKITADASTVMSDRSIQAASVSFSNVSENQFTFNWRDGNGTKRVVFIKQDTAGTASPANNSSYTASSLYGAGSQIGATGWFCVFNGTTHESGITVTNLNANTTYRVMVFEYSGNVGTEQYNTTTAVNNPNNQRTCYNVVPTISGPISACKGAVNVTYSTEPGMLVYEWAVSSGGTITSGSATNAIQVTWNLPGLQTVSVFYTNSPGCAASSPTIMNVSVYPPPTPGIIGAATACVSSAGNVYETQTGKTGYIWTVSSGGTMTSGSGTSSITVSWNSTGNQVVSVNYTSENGCAAAQAATKSVTVHPVIIPGINGTSVSCLGNMAEYTTETGMFNYFWTVSSGGTIMGPSNTSSVTVVWNTPGSQSVSVLYNDFNGCTSSTPTVRSISVYALPMPVITGVTSVCANSAGIEYFTEPGMTGYIWTITSGGTITAGNGTNSIIVTWFNPGTQTVTVHYANLSGCSPEVPATRTITVFPAPQPTISGPSGACAENIVHYTTEPGMTAYTWLAGAGGIITSGLGTPGISVRWTQPGTRTLTVNYLNPQGCQAMVPAIYTVTVNPQPSPFLTGPNQVCDGAAGNVYSTLSGQSDYVWSVSAGGIITGGGTQVNDQVTVSWNTVGLQTVSVNYTSQAGCTAALSTTYPVTVDALPYPTITGPESACQNTGGHVYQTETGMTAYGWTVNGPPGTTIVSGADTPVCNVTWGGPGPSTGSIQVQVTNGFGCSAASASKNVSIAQSVAAAVSVTASLNPVCAGSGVIFTAHPVNGGTSPTYQWKVNGLNTGLNSITFSYVPSNNDVVSCILTPGPPEPCNNGNPVVSNIISMVVSSLPVPNIIGPATTCQDTGGITYSTEPGMTAYIWTISQGGTITGGSGTNAVTINWNAFGTQYVSVNYTNTLGCTALIPSLKTIIVNQSPAPTIAGPDEACLNATVNYATESGKALYNWSVGNGGVILSGLSTSMVVVKWIQAGNHTITVNYTDPATGCVAGIPGTMSVMALPAPVPAISGPSVVCAGPSVFSYSTEPGMTSYAWVVSSGGTITSGAGTNSISVVWTVAGSQFIGVSYTDILGCNSAYPTLFNVTVNAGLGNPSLWGPAVVCQGTNSYTYVTDPGKWSYNWSVSPGGTILTNSSSQTNIITVAWNGAGAQSVEVSYYMNGCTSNSTIRNVFVDPFVLPTITGPDPACSGSSVLYYTEGNMTNYSWNVSQGGTILAGAGTSMITVRWEFQGNCSVSVNYTTQNGCSAAVPAVKTVVVNPSPLPQITGTTVLCQGSSGVAYFTESGMNNYSWNIPTGGIITGGLGTNAITVTWQLPGSRSLNVNYTTPAGCQASDPTTKLITVLPVPSPVISGPETVTVGNTQVYSTGPGMIIYIWSVSQGGTIISGSGTSNIMVNWHSTGPQSVSVDVINSSGCSSVTPAVLNVQVNPPSVVTVENVTIPAGQSACFDAAQTITVAGNNTYFIVQPGGSATMIAGKNIRYLVGTTVRSGGYMHGYITTTGQYCGMMAPTMVTLPTGVDPVSDIASLPEFKIYPNPTTGLLYVESVGDHASGMLKLEVFGMQGDKIMTKEFDPERKYEFSLAGKPTGIYLVRIIAGEYVKTFRVIKR